MLHNTKSQGYVLHSDGLEEFTVIHVVHLAKLVWLSGLSRLAGLGGGLTVDSGLIENINH